MALMVLLWNSGDLDRRVAKYFLIDTICSDFHLCLLQAGHSTRLPNVMSHRGMAYASNPHSEQDQLMVVTGASGHKVVVPLYPNFSGGVPRPWTPGESMAMYFRAGDGGSSGCGWTKVAECHLGRLAAEVRLAVDGPK